MLAALGLDILLRPLRPQARRVVAAITRAFWWMAGVLALVGLPLLGYAVLRARALPRGVLEQTVTSMGSLIFFLLMLGASLGWLALRRHRLASPATLGVMAMCLIVFDLTSQGATVEIEPNDPLVGYRHEQAIEFLKGDPDIYRVETPAEVKGNDIRILNAARSSEFDPATQVILKKGEGAAPLDVDPHLFAEVLDAGVDLDGEVFGHLSPTKATKLVTRQKKEARDGAN